MPFAGAPATDIQVYATIICKLPQTCLTLRAKWRRRADLLCPLALFCLCLSNVNGDYRLLRTRKQVLALACANMRMIASISSGMRCVASGFQGVQPLARPSRDLWAHWVPWPSGFLPLALRLLADWNMHRRGVCLGHTAD